MGCVRQGVVAGGGFMDMDGIQVAGSRSAGSVRVTDARDAADAADAADVARLHRVSPGGRNGLAPRLHRWPGARRIPACCVFCHRPLSAGYLWTPLVAMAMCILGRCSQCSQSSAPSQALRVPAPRPAAGWWQTRRGLIPSPPHPRPAPALVFFSFSFCSVLSVCVCLCVCYIICLSACTHDALDPPPLTPLHERALPAIICHVHHGRLAAYNTPAAPGPRTSQAVHQHRAASHPRKGCQSASRHSQCSLPHCSQYLHKRLRAPLDRSRPAAPDKTLAVN
jgi:hypothetical protein